MRHAVNETNTLDQFTESLARGYPVPTPLCFERELQHRGDSAVLGEGTLHALGAVAQLGERELDGIGRANVEPMLGRKIIKGK